MKKVISIILVLALSICLVGCEYHAGKSVDLGDSVRTGNNFKTKNHQTVGSGYVEDLKKGYASFDISEDGLVQVTTFDFQLPSGYKAEAPVGILDKATNHVLNQILIRNSEDEIVTVVVDGRLANTWSTNSMMALKEIASIFEDIDMPLDGDFDSIDASQLLVDDLYALNVGEAGVSDPFVQFVADRTGDSFAMTVGYFCKDESINLLIYNALLDAYSSSNTSTSAVTTDTTDTDVIASVNAGISDNITEDSSVEDNSVFDIKSDSALDGDVMDVNSTYVEETNKNINNSLSDDATDWLLTRDTDFSKVNWQILYSPFDDESLAISVAPWYDTSNQLHLIVGLTNLYSKPVNFKSAGYVKGVDGSNICDISIFDLAIGTGSTIIHDFNCGDAMTDGSIRWENIELSDSYNDFVTWESDWAIAKDSEGYFNIPFALELASEASPGYVTALLLDSHGNIIDLEKTYKGEDGTNIEGVINTYKKEFTVTPSDLALFVNPIK